MIDLLNNNNIATVINCIPLPVFWNYRYIGILFTYANRIVNVDI